MRLRRAQICPIHHSRSCCGQEAVPKERRMRQIGSVASTIRIILAATGNSVPIRRCENCPIA